MSKMDDFNISVNLFGDATEENIGEETKKKKIRHRIVTLGEPPNTT